MKSLWINLILIAALIVAVNNHSIAQTPEQLYQKGLMKEEGEGILKDAIDLYSQVADNLNADQSLRAKALLHIGMCYEKLGTEQAVKAYQRLVNNFPAQKSEVSIAMERLSRLTTKESPGEIIIRQVWTGQEADGFGSVSADGEYLSFTDWETGNLAVRNLKTGENKQVTQDATWKDSTQYAEYSLISPDGNQFVYTWYYKDLYYELRLLKSGNQKPLTLYSCKNFDEYITPGVWFSDGNRIIAQKYNITTRSRQLLLINTYSGEIEVLKEQLPGPPPGQWITSYLISEKSWKKIPQNQNIS
jgi:tetratricopeptide (TPR) repeat protein